MMTISPRAARTSSFRALVAFALAAGLAGCASPRGDAPEPDEDDEVTTTASGVAYARVPEAFFTARTPDDNIDSPASWQPGDGTTWLIATAKASDRLVVYDGDDGRTIRTVGARGDGPGQFRRPNGVFVIDDLLFVVERDNRRVQVLRLPTFASLATFGRDELVQPYGLWLHRDGDGYEVLVSDAYMSEADEDAPPPLAQLDRRYKRYRVTASATGVDARFVDTFGDTGDAGAIRIPESLWGDPVHGRLLLAEEDQSIGTRIRVYDAARRYAGRDLGAGLFHAQAEGIALWACGDGTGYWLATDQYKDRSVFHVFDRESLAHLGAFAGDVTANTDGVWLQQAPTRAFPSGVFYAVDDDRGVAAFDWRGIAKSLALRRECVTQ